MREILYNLDNYQDNLLNLLNDFTTFSNQQVKVNELSDLPAPDESGVITLVDDTTYEFSTDLDLEGSCLECGSNTVLLGYSSENSILRSTGLDSNTALIKSEWTLPIRHIKFIHDKVFDLDATANAGQALDWRGVNVENSSNIGTIKNYSNFVVSSMAFINSSGLTFDGEFGTVSFNECLFDSDSGGTSLILPSTLTITRRFRIIYSAFVTLSGETGLNVSTSATIPSEGYILDTVNFTGGGTYTTGVAYDDDKSRWDNCRGVNNTSSVCNYYMTGNSTATTIDAANTPVKIAGANSGVSPVTQGFTVTDGRATYDRALTRDFKITYVLTCTAGNNNELGFYIAKNGAPDDASETYLTTNTGGRVENGFVQGVATLSQGDYIEPWVENADNTTDVTVVSINVILEPIT